MKLSSQSPRVSVDVPTVCVERGEVLTVWLNRAEYPKRDAVQIELRVQHDGTPELFCVGGSVPVMNFDEWEAMRPWGHSSSKGTDDG